MRTKLTRRQLTIVATTSFISIPTRSAFSDTSPRTLKFLDKDYVLRAEENGNLFMFTPTDQTDLKTRTDMFSVVAYQNVVNYADLQEQKNDVLTTFKQPGSVVFTEKDAPPSPGFRGESFLVTGKGGQGYTDACFSRFTLASGIGYALVYTRSFYDANSPGGDSAQALGDWINAKGTGIASALLDFTIVLNQTILRDWENSLSRIAK
jgi:hypothetical protein